MLQQHIKGVLDEIEAEAQHLDATAILRRLRVLGLTDFSLLLTTLPNESYPHISAKLPAMASEKVQMNWTGNKGIGLLGQTLSFVNCASSNYVSISKETLQDKRILDFGCGYGRMIRCMYYYSDPANIFGVDPWNLSVEICNNDGLLGDIRQSDYIPKDLPFDGMKFDFMYAFSVFTHLSERTTRTCLRTLRDYVADNGVLAITIRPVEYWRTVKTDIDGVSYASGNPAHPMVQQHTQSGFAFYPHKLPPVDGEITYGDTSMTLEWLASTATGWKIAGYDRSINDQVQRYVFLVPA